MDMDPSTVHLVLVFKAPSQAKSRLRKQVGASTDQLASRLLDCAMEDLRLWQGPVTLAATSEQDAHWLTTSGRWPDPPLLQGAGNLGERLTEIDLELRRQGAERIIFVGSDCPAMDLTYLNKAADRLAQQDYVLGAALDGGVTLMGARRPWPALVDLPWSTRELGATLALRCQVTLMQPTLRDVDDIDDLAPLLAELANDQRPTRITLCNWLETWLS